MKTRYFCTPLLSLGLSLAWLGLAGHGFGAPAIIPQPQLLEERAGTFTLCPSQGLAGTPGRGLTRIQADAASLETGQYLANQLANCTGYRFAFGTNAGAGPLKGAIVLTTLNADSSLGAEGYELTVAPDSVLIRAPAQAGLFYGVQSLLQLLPPQALAARPVSGVAWTMPCVYIRDTPRFVWRGWMLDVVRHFFSKQELKQLLDGMALHKLNTFHWHLVDDQGWRLEILRYPLLTQVGAWRNDVDWSLNKRASSAWNAAGQYGGFYTQADVRELIAYAAARHITIVPEIEMPGHSIAAMAAYPENACTCAACNLGPYNMDAPGSQPNGIFCLGKTNTLPFLKNVLSEVVGLFPSHFIHIGGDEVNFNNWRSDPLDESLAASLGVSDGAPLQRWFAQQMADFLQAQGRQMIGWSEIMNGGLVTNAAVTDWKNGTSSVATFTATNGQPVVLSPSAFCYVDHPESTNPTWAQEPPAFAGVVISLSTIYNFEPVPVGLPSEFVPLILGAQANLWCEYVPSALNVQFKAYPRLCAMAELTWTAANLKNFTSFTNRLSLHRQRLSQMGLNQNSNVVAQAGSWIPAQISTAYSSLQWDITPSVRAGGEIDVSFLFTSGANALNIQWVALLENGVELDRDTHAGSAGAAPSAAIYVLRLEGRRPGATYAIRASVAGRGGSDSSGNVYLPNWN